MLIYVLFLTKIFIFFDRFASLLGKILTELAVNGSTKYDIDSFTMQREAIQNRSFKPVFWRGDMNMAKL